MNDQNLTSWIGNTEISVDYLAQAPLVGLAATLDYTANGTPWRQGWLPPLAHWLYFLPKAQQSDIDIDGHPRRGGFLPPIDLPRRMWAGGALQFHAPIPTDVQLHKRSVLTSIKHKRGSTGDLVFVTVEHRYGVDADALLAGSGGSLLTERQDIVYREAAARPALTAGSAGSERSGTTTASSPARAGDHGSPAPDWLINVPADPTRLFRFSALTFNAHRIHYDRDYATTVEGYPGLVVHGPLCATLLMDLFLRHHPGTTVRAFTFKALRPLFDTHAFHVCGKGNDNGAKLWICDADGQVTMQAMLEAS